MVGVFRHDVEFCGRVLGEIFKQRGVEAAALHLAPPRAEQLGGHAADDGFWRDGRHVLANEAVGGHDGLVGDYRAAGYRSRVAYPAVVADADGAGHARHHSAAEVGHEVEICVKYLTSVNNPGLFTDPYFRVGRDVAECRDFGASAHVEYAILTHVYLVSAAYLARASEDHLAPDVQLGVAGGVLRPAGNGDIQADHTRPAHTTALHRAELREQPGPAVNIHGKTHGLAKGEEYEVEIQSVKGVEPVRPQRADNEQGVSSP